MKCFRCTSWPCTCPDGITLIYGDCREILPQLPPVDLVLTDIPYNASQDSNGLRTLDYGDWDRDFDHRWLVCSLGPLVLDGSIYVWCGDTQFSDLIADLKTTGFLDRPNAWAKRNPSVINGDKIWLPGLELCAFGKRRGGLFNAHCKSNVWWDAPDVERFHPCQKPLAIIGQQIMASSNTGQLVLDPFIGSGTTLVAAKQLGRRAIGIEIELKYVEIAANRLRQEVLQFGATDG